MLHVTETRYLEDFRLWLAFNDGQSGVVDLAKHLWGPMFEPLRDKAVFRQCRLDPELDTLVWSNGADLAPEFLRGCLSEDDAKST
ncbi:MAG: DUF2442 domain-containing protein [Magnetococcales bacterium]|nr:DUF2442 domain-containing protein [Magnetococcales bacterium]